jgi:hypothetical protein
MPPLLRFLLLLLGLLCFGPQAGAQESPRRLALLVGSNDGGPRRQLLRHAQSDAEAMARVLVELGGVAPADQFLLRDPTPATLRQSLRQVEQRAIKAGAEQAEVLVYYSGHSDQYGLLLGGERFPYSELRDTLEALPARVRVAIVDSCASGAMVRDKGGQHLPKLATRLTSSVRGYALLTSASADEAAQESDALGSSFFTHYLVTGLRGAADSSGDGQVTLAEAYGFAFDATLSETARSSGGPQHPAYDMQLAGTGELVLTDLHLTGASLSLEPSSPTLAWVRDGAGRLLAELDSGPSKPVRIGLSPGNYVITLRREERWAELRVQLAGGEQLRVTAEQLTWRDSNPSAQRGGREQRQDRGLLHWPLRVNTLPTRADPQVVEHVAINLLMGRSAYLHGFALGVGGSIVERDAHGVLLAVGTNIVGGSANGLQLAGGLNRTGRHVRAWQLAGGTNLTQGYLRGFQLAGGLNRVRGPAAGFQLAGATNLAGHELVGLQISGGLNRSAERMQGVQLAGLTNLSGGTAQGLQLAGAYNQAPIVEGVQLGAVNLSRSAAGVQLGLVNVSQDVYGLQLGLINVSETGRATIGLVNLVREGRREVHLVSTAREPGGVEIHMGGELIYTLLGAGLVSGGTPAWRWGLGGAVHIGAQRIAVEGLVGTYGPAPTGAARALLVQPRLAWECPLAGPAKLVLGPSWDLWIPLQGNTMAAPSWLWQWSDRDCTSCFHHGPGFVAGLGVAF